MFSSADDAFPVQPAQHRNMMQSQNANSSSSFMTSSYFSHRQGKRQRANTGMPQNVSNLGNTRALKKRHTYDSSGDHDSEAHKNEQHAEVCASAMAVFYEDHDLGVASFLNENNELSVGWTACPDDEVLRRQLLLFAEVCSPAFVLVSSSATAFLVQECERLFPEGSTPTALCKSLVPVGASQSFTSSQGNILLEELCQTCASHAIANSALCAAGGLLTFLLQHQVIIAPMNTTNFRGEVSSSPLLRLVISNATQSVLIDKISLDALGVFSRDRHPNVHGAQTHKEGYSLARLIGSFARQKGSRKLIRSWLRRPSNDDAIISYRYNTIEVFLQPSANSENISAMLFEVGKMQSIAPAIRRMRSLAASSIQLHDLRDWKITYEFCCLANRLRNLSRTIIETSHGGVDVSTVNTSFHLMARIPAQIDELCHRISSVIDFKKSTSCVPARAFPRRGLDADLDAWRKIDDGLGSFLEQVAQDAAIYDCGPTNVLYDRFDCQVRVEYRPQVGYTMLLCGVKQADLQEVQQLGVNWGMQFVFMERMNELDYSDGVDEHLSKSKAIQLDYLDKQSVSGRGVASSNRDNAEKSVDDYRFILHFKTARMVEMDSTIGDVTVQIADAEAKILLELRNKILLQDENLMFALHAMFEFDALAAMAKLANEKNYVRPILVRPAAGGHESARGDNSGSCSVSSELELVEGRHPLQEFSVEQFIPNSINITEQGSIILITGPNSSGKSIFLKTVGLLTIMAKAGSFVPAKTFKVPYIDQIFTRITNQESVSTEESAFTIDLHQVNAALNNSTTNSLVLIDEFGKGTIAVDGVALLAAAIRRLDSIGPKVILTTHAWELFDQHLIVPCSRVRTYHMEVLVEDRTTQEQDQEVATIRQNIDVDQTKYLTYAHKVVPLYNLIPGRASSSMTLACARQNGFLPSVLNRAQHIINNLRSGRPLQSISNIVEFAPAWAHEHKRRNDARKSLILFLLEKRRDLLLHQKNELWEDGDFDKLFEFIKQLGSTYIPSTVQDNTPQ